MYPTILTIGHSTHALEAFIHLLQENDTECVVDVRSVPRSRRNPQFNRDELAGSLSAVGIGYTHLAGLGGFRKPRVDSPNIGWRNSGFRGYADYMATAQFEESLALLLELARERVVVLMCAEALPWRCHRFLISDALVVRGVGVVHIFGDARRAPHRLTPFARVEGSRLTYPQAQPHQSFRDTLL